MGMRWAIITLLLVLTTLSSQSAWKTGWTYRVKLTTQNSKVNADLSNYPLYVNLADLGSGHGFWTHVLSTGADLRVTSSDGTTELPIEVVAIDTTAKTGEVHFKASSIANATNSDFYLYYGNGDASAYATSATYGRNNVWTGYAAVWHMQEDPSGSAPQIIDSTGNSNSATSSGSMTSGDLVASKINKGIDFDGTNDVLTVGDTASLEMATVSVQLWARFNSQTGIQTIMGRRGNAGAPYKLRTGCAASQDICFQVAPGITQSPSIDKTTDYLQDGATWYMIHGTYSNSDKCRLYKNGTEKGTGTAPAGAISTSTTNTFEIGSDQAFPGWVNGVLDELRVTSTVLSSTWISTEYNNQNSSSTFYTLGSEETETAGVNRHIFLDTLF